MDRNSIIGIILIFLVLVVFSVINQPSREEIESLRRKQDSIQQVELEKAREMQLLQQQQALAEPALPDSIIQETKKRDLESQLGVFGAAGEGEESFKILGNNIKKL